MWVPAMVSAAATPRVAAELPVGSDSNKVEIF